MPVAVIIFILYFVWMVHSALGGSSLGSSSPMMIITNSGGSTGNGKAFRCELSGSPNCTKLRLTSPRPIHSVYDPVEDYIYWTDFDLHTICRVDWLDENLDRRWVQVSENPIGLAIDPSMRVIFFHTNGLKRVDMKTKVVLLIHSSIGWGTMTLDTKRKKIYVTEYTENILRMVNYDGSQLETVISRGLSGPRGIFYEQEAHTLYYCEVTGREMGMLDLNTNESTVIYNKGPCLSLAVFEGVIYFTSSERSGKVFELPVNGGTVSSFSFVGSVSAWARINVFRRKECKDGTYGRGCSSSCGNCREGTVCEKSAGLCLRGCEPGWIGGKCDEDCNDGLYGAGCRSNCGHCHNNQPCRKSSGECLNGCEPGWSGPSCTTECSNGTYGHQCASLCGRCREGTVCEKTHGLCPYGCQSGWEGLRCHTVTDCEPKTNCRWDEPSGNIPSSPVGSNHLQLVSKPSAVDCNDGLHGAGCRNICGHCHNNQPCRKSSGECLNGCEPGWSGSSCTTECSNGTYGPQCASLCGRCREGAVCEKIQGLCPHGCQSGWEGLRCHTVPETKVAGWILGVICAIFILLVVSLVTIIFRKRLCIYRQGPPRIRLRGHTMTDHENPIFKDDL